MNSSLSPNSQTSELSDLEMDKPRGEANLPSAIEPSGEANESVQSLYDPEPIEPLSDSSLTSRGQMLFQRGVSSLRAGATDEALEIWRQARSEFPSHAIIAHNLGLAAGAAQQYGEAIAAFREANNLDKSLIVSNLNSVCTSIPLMNYQARVDEVLGQCEVLREQGKWKDAEKTAARLLDEYPHSSAALAELSLALAGRAQNEHGKSDELLAQALQHARRAIFLDPTLPAGFAALATTQRFLGTHQEAFASSLHALELQPRPDSSSRLFAGEQALRASKSEKNDLDLARIAVEYADEVIAQEPDNVRAWTLRADANALRMAEGSLKWDENLTDFERLLQLDPTNGHALKFRDFLQAQCYQDEVVGKLRPVFKEALGHLEANENEKALPLLRQILQAEPDNCAALSNLSLALRRLKRFDEALSVQTHLAGLSPTPESWRLVASIATSHEQANNAYLQVVKLLPGDARSHGDVAKTLEAMGRPKEAVPYWRRVLELTPEDRDAWFRLGKNFLDRAGSQRPVDEHLVREAIPALDKADALDGKNTDVASQLAVALAELGDSDTASSYASRLTPHDPVGHSALVQVLTDIHSRRLSEGLASRPISPELLPLLTPPTLPVESTSDPLIGYPFSPIVTRSVSPWLVGVVGLAVIFGTWSAIHWFGLGYATPWSQGPRPPMWEQPDPANFQPPPLQSNFLAAPFVKGNAPAPPVAPPMSNSRLTGRWEGIFNNAPARLIINRHDGSSISGALFVGEEDNNSVQIQINGTLASNTISLHERQVTDNPRQVSWRLGEDKGTITQRGDVMQIQGSGENGLKTYSWSFSRSLESSPPLISDSASDSPLLPEWTYEIGGPERFSFAYPSSWMRSAEADGKRKRVSFNAPQTNVQLILDIVPATTTSPITQWQAENKRLRREYESGYHLVDFGPATLGGKEGAKWQFVLQRPGESPLEKLERRVTYNGQSYTLLMVAPDKDFWKWSPTFNHIVDSFSFE